MITTDSLDFDGWTLLISQTENTCPNDTEKISSVYEPFLCKFPLCHCYWKRYADHMERLCSTDKAGEIFERGLHSATHCVSLWVDYFSFSMYAFQDPSDIRRLFQRGMSYVGKDYLCYTLWDKFIKFEYSQENWSSLAHIFIQTLRFPTKKLHSYYDNLKKFAALMEEEMKCEIICHIEAGSEAVPDFKVTKPEHEISQVIKDLQDLSNGSVKSKALQKYLLIGEHFYNKACQLDEKIRCFETGIKSLFFDVKPLDDNQLENWHRYLDFIEKQDDFDWAVKLYERCLISCANYPEFWMRYVEFVENKGGRELANFALERATQIILKDVTAIHIFNARYKEKIGDAFGARAAFLQCDAESSYVNNVIKEANMEKRLGNLVSASAVYEKALKMVAERRLHIVPALYIHFSRLQYTISGSADVAINILTDGIQHMLRSKLLLKELINFAMTHEGSKHVNTVDSIIAHAIAPVPDESQGLSPKDREELSSLHLEFVDLCGTNHDIRKAWNRHIRLFPCFLRSISTYNHPISSDQLLSGTKEGSQKNIFAKRSQPFNAHCTGHSGELPAEEKLTNGTQPTVNDKFTDALVHQTGDDVERMKLSNGLVYPPREDLCGSIKLSHDLAHKFQDDASQPIKFDHPPAPVRPSEASQKYSNPISTQQDQEKGNELDLAKHPDPVSLENLSLDSQDFSPMVNNEHGVPQKIPTCTEENPSTADYAILQNQINEKELTSHKILTSAQTRPLHEMNMQLQVQNGSTGLTQFQANASQGNIATSHQSSVHASQSQMSSHPTFPYPQVSQYPTQGSDQAYSQMWQYQYQQQLMQQQYQQQNMHMQPYFSQHQHPSRPPPPAQQQHFPQQQLQPSSYQPQQLDQQQYLLYMQQQQQQQIQYHRLGEVASQQQGYQLQLQKYQQQQEQGYQLWLQQQEGYKHQQQNHENQGQHQQAQGIRAPCNTSAPGSSESPPAMTGPHYTGAPRPVVSPHQQQATGGVSRSLSTVPPPSFQTQ